MLKNIEITYCHDVMQPTVFKTVTLESAVNAISSCKHEFEINRIRKITDKTERGKHKKKLPWYAFGGTFKGSIANDNLVQHSGFFHFDIDDIPNVDKAKGDLKQIVGMALLFTSLSGNGIKGLIHCSHVANDKEYKRLFDYFEKEIKDHGYTIDPACKDIRRACFVSHDPGLFVDYGAVLHEVDLSEKPIVQSMPAKSKQDVDLRELLQYINPDCDYATWCNVGFAIYSETNGTGFDFWDSWSAGGQKYDSTQENFKKWQSFGKSTNPKKIGYLIQEAKKGGYVKKKSKNAHIINDVHKNLEKRNKAVDLLQYLDDKSLAFRYSDYVARVTHIPRNSAFLMGMGIFSSMSVRAYHVAYEHDSGILPIGLYCLSEQPPGSSKSYCLNLYKKPFFEIYSDIPDLDHRPKLFISDTTPEALEQTLENSKGFFSLESSEQSLLDTLLGACYQQEGKKQNNGMVLHGFDGGWSSSTRVTRKGYEGYVCGGFTTFAQEGTIATVLNSSNGTGLSDRFLMLSEPHMLGKRDHFKKPVYEKELIQQYEDKCFFARSVIADPVSLKNTTKLSISPEGYRLLNQLKQDIEPHLADGAKYSNSSIRGAASKLNMQSMKIAANLHLLNGTGTEIADETISQAINISIALLDNMVDIANDKEIIGMKANVNAVLNYFEKTKSKSVKRSQIVNSLRATKPFKEVSSGARDAVHYTINVMIEREILGEGDSGIFII